MTLTALLVAVASTAAGCGGSDAAPTPQPRTVEDPAAEFAVGVHVALARGQFARAWRSLHPAQQRLLRAADLADCWSQGRQAALEQRLKFEARGVRDEDWKIPGGPQEPQPSKAVRVRILAQASSAALDVFTQHVFEVEEGYRWIVSAPIMTAFRRGDCGTG